MFYKTCLFLLLTTFILTQSTSCRKDAINTLSPVDTLGSIDTISSIYSHFTGSFYCKKYNSYGYSSGNQSIYQADTADIVTLIAVSNDTLIVGGAFPFYNFVIDSANQTSFIFEATPYIPNNPPPYRVYLAFFNNYDSVVIEYENLAYQTGAGGGGGEIFYGTRSQLNTSSIPHAYINALEGNYVLEVEEKRYQTSVDTQYRATLLVEQPNYKLLIGNNEFTVGTFHSWLDYDKYHSYGSIHYTEKHSVYWANDSLFFESKIIYYPSSSHGIDTVFYRFKGVKQ